MMEFWLPVLIVVGIAAVGLYLVSGRRPAEPIVFENEREERLTRRLTQMVRCPLAVALQAIRKELHIAPGQADETLLKRAAYHYRQDQPEKVCSIYRDRARG